MRRPFSSATVASRRRCGGNQLEITMRRRALQEFAPKAAARKNSLCRVGLYCQGCCRVMMMGVQSLTALAAVGELLYKIWCICASQRERQFGERGAKKSLQLYAWLCVYCNNWRAASIHIYNVPRVHDFCVCLSAYFHSLRVCASRVIIIVLLEGFCCLQKVWKGCWINHTCEVRGSVMSLMWKDSGVLHIHNRALASGQIKLICFCKRQKVKLFPAPPGHFDIKFACWMK